MRLHATVLYVAITILVGSLDWTVYALHAQCQELVNEQTHNQSQEIKAHSALVQELKTTIEDMKRQRDRDIKAHSTLVQELKTTIEDMKRQRDREAKAHSTLVREPRTTIEDVNRQLMRQLGIRASTGQRNAIDEIQKIADKLYKNIDYKREKERMSSNLMLMRTAFEPIGLAAGKGSQEALESLFYANRTSRLRSFVPHEMGTAAAMGNREALEALLHHDRHGWLLSSTVFALQDAAENGVPEAVDFLIKVVDDDSATALWHGATQGLIAVAYEGNERAQQALDKYAAYKEARKKKKQAATQGKKQTE